MIPRVTPAILVLLKSGFYGTKYDIAERVFATQRTCQRLLAQLEQDGQIRICQWTTKHQAYIPVYEYRNGIPSLQMPTPLTKNKKLYHRKYRKENPEYCIRQAVAKRAKRQPTRTLVKEWYASLESRNAR